MSPFLINSQIVRVPRYLRYLYTVSTQNLMVIHQYNTYSCTPYGVPTVQIPPRARQARTCQGLGVGEHFRAHGTDRIAHGMWVHYFVRYLYAFLVRTQLQNIWHKLERLRDRGTKKRRTQFYRWGKAASKLHTPPPSLLALLASASASDVDIQETRQGRQTWEFNDRDSAVPPSMPSLGSLCYTAYRMPPVGIPYLHCSVLRTGPYLLPNPNPDFQIH